MGPRIELSPAQRQMYASEKQANFRWISKVLASSPPYTLTASDLVSSDLLLELAQLGQFAEVAYDFFAPGPEFIFRNLDILTQPGFPLEGYGSLRGTLLSSSLTGTVANLPAYVAYRSATRQLIVAISGTSRLTHALYDIHSFKYPHPLGKDCAVHTGFWKLYQGLKSATFKAIRKGLREHSVGELVITGHSMGGALSYLLALDILADSEQLPTALPVKIAVFGAPRCGNAALLQRWCELVDGYRKKYGEGAIKEYEVRGYNDGKSFSRLLSSEKLTSVLVRRSCTATSGIWLQAFCTKSTVFCTRTPVPHPIFRIGAYTVLGFAGLQ